MQIFISISFYVIICLILNSFHNIALSDKKYPYLVCYFKFSVATKQRFCQDLVCGRPVGYIGSPLRRHDQFVVFYFYCKIMLISKSYNYCSVLTANKCFIETELIS